MIAHSENQAPGPSRNMGCYVTAENLDSKTQEWLKRVASFNRADLRLNRDRSVLLVVDMQNFFLDAAAPAFLESGRAILPTVKRLIEKFRTARRPVIFTRHAHHPDGLDAGIMEWWWDDMCTEGSPESEIDPEVAPLPGEKVILKHRYSAFYGTDLEMVLRVLRAEDLVICGVMTNLCCESTARDAYYRDYRVFFVADGTGANCEEMHVASLMNLAYGFAKVTTAQEVLGALVP